jgi:glycosyltransferase involved in cell wall biosynthesis
MTDDGPTAAAPGIAYLSYSSGEFDARSMRMARSAVEAGWRVTIYARLEAGHPDLEERDGYRLVRVPADWRRAVPGLRGRARRDGRRALAEARQIRDSMQAPEMAEPDDEEEPEDGDSEGPSQPEPRSEARVRGPRSILRRLAGKSRAGARRLGSPVARGLRRWQRHLFAFPLRPMGWAVALDEFVEPADVWHGMWAGSLPALERQRRRLGGRTIYDSRDVYMLARDRARLERPLRSLIGWLERRFARRMDRVLTVNEPYADLLVRQLGVTRPPVVMNCPDLWQGPESAADRIRNALGLESATAIVLYQGQLITERGIEQAMEAILDVPGAALALLGYGPLEAQIRERIALPPYRDRVFLLPAVPPDELLAWTASADVSVIPIQPTTVNHRFSTPQKLFESLAAGVPVVASDLPGMAGIVRSTGVGLLCDPTSPAAIARALREIVAAPDTERTALRARVREAVADRYNWRAQARTLFALYDELAGRSPGQARRSPGRRTARLATRAARERAGGPRGLLRRITRRPELDRLVRLARGARAAAREGLLQAVRHPGLALARARLELRDLGPVELRHQAVLADRHGELTTGLALWSALAERGDRDARRRARLVEGRLAETDPTWLPPLEGAVDVVAPISRRRILHLVKGSVPDRWSGFTIRTINNMRAQAAAGLEPIVATEIGWPRVAGVTRFEPRVQVDGILHIRLDRGPGYDPLALPNDLRLADLATDLLPVIREVRPAILQAHSGHRGGEHALVALALREKTGIPVVYEVRGLFESVWSSEDIDVEHAELFARRLAQENRILREVDGVLAISEALIDHLAGRGIPRDRMSLLPNGIDPEAFRPVARSEAVRQRLGLAGRFVVGYVGNLDHRREGIDVLIAALAELRRRDRSDVAVLVVGDGETRPALEAAAARRGVAAACVFTGRVPHDEVAQYYAQMDVFANPRIDEWASRFITPLKPFEAMALERPVLVSDLPALREIVDPPNRGLTAPPGDPDGLADAIARLQDDPELRARIAAAGKAWVLAERTWAANGPRYRAAYEAILGPLGDEP